MFWENRHHQLAIFKPLIGTWVSQSNSVQGPVLCTKTFEAVLKNNYIQIKTVWSFSNTKYEELLTIGVDDNGFVTFWSHDSEGNRANGRLTNVKNKHPKAIGLESNMPTGLSRQVFIPNQEKGFSWIVEIHTKKGWQQLLDHHYKKLEIYNHPSKK